MVHRNWRGGVVRGREAHLRRDLLAAARRNKAQRPPVCHACTRQRDVDFGGMCPECRTDYEAHLDRESDRGEDRLAREEAGFLL